MIAGAGSANTAGPPGLLLRDQWSAYLVGREGLLGLRPRPFEVSIADATLLSRPTASASASARTFDHRIKRRPRGCKTHFNAD